MDTIEIIITIAASLALGAVIVSYIVFNKKKPPQVADDFVNQIVTGLGGIINVSQINKENQRIKILLINPKLVDPKIFEHLGLAAFLVGKELKILVKTNSEAVYQALLQIKSGDDK